MVNIDHIYGKKDTESAQSTYRYINMDEILQKLNIT